MYADTGILLGKAGLLPTNIKESKTDKEEFRSGLQILSLLQEAYCSIYTRMGEVLYHEGLLPQDFPEFEFSELLGVREINLEEELPDFIPGGANFMPDPDDVEDPEEATLEQLISENERLKEENEKLKKFKEQITEAFRESAAACTMGDAIYKAMSAAGITFE